MFDATDTEKMIPFQYISFVRKNAKNIEQKKKKKKCKIIVFNY